jgi:hypothetical protein
VHSSASGARNLNALFFMLGWARCGLHKKRARTHYAKFVFLHPMGSAGHVVHSCASGHKTSTHYFSCSGGPVAVFIKCTLGHVTVDGHKMDIFINNIPTFHARYRR